jgi:hypothetical protein
MAKRKALSAPEVAYVMGLTPPAQTPDGKDIKYGRKALVGQYTKRYTREDGTEGVLDLSEAINAKR